MMNDGCQNHENGKSDHAVARTGIDQQFFLGRKTSFGRVSPS